MPASAKLIRAIRRELRAGADPVKAPGMQRYMKSAMPYLGVYAPILKSLTRELFAEHLLENFEDWRDTVLVLWRGAKYREERYAAISLAGHKSYLRFQTLDALPMYEEMIVSGAWWDYVDSIASAQLGAILRHSPRETAAVLKAWAKDPDIWKRRSAILAQLNFKSDTDRKLLYACIRPSLGHREFFLRKAIGWALREYAWTEPDEVRRYVREHETQLSALSKREALKHAGLP